MDLNLFWFITLGVLLTGYAILDGFDLGVGILHLFVREDGERRVFLNSIGPLWDGNEVWLVTFGGALFAAFPHAYATAFSGFYIPFMLLLFMLIFRGVSMEFRSKQEMRWWRTGWDVSFSLASMLATFLFGLAIGDMMSGLPVGADMEYRGTASDLFTPYSVLVGCFAVATFAMHGSIYLYLKTEGALQRTVKSWMWRTFFIFLGFYLAVSLLTFTTLPGALRNFSELPAAWIIVVLNILAVANIPRAIHVGKPFYAFLSSSCTIAAMTFLFGFALFPNLIVSSLDPRWSLTIYNAASSQTTLGLMRWIAFLGMPFVLTYTIVIYWIFRGKVKLGKFSY